MSAYTPGPWRTGSASKQSNFGDWTARVTGTDEVGVVTVAKVRSGNGPADTREIANANARLIAAAPDLVETLATVREAIEGFVDVNDGEFGPLPNWAMALTQKIDAALERAGIDPSA